MGKYKLTDNADYDGVTHLFFTGDKELASFIDAEADYTEICIEYPVGYPDYNLSKVYVGVGKYIDKDLGEVETLMLSTIQKDLFNELISQLPLNKIRPFEFGGVTGKQPTFEELPFK